jgi:serine protease Do
MKNLTILIFFLIHSIGAFAFGQNELSRLSRSFEELSRKVGPAVVQVFVTGYSGDESNLSSESLLTRQRSTGSGVIIDREGYVITNAHVVQGALRVQVMLSAAVDEGSPRQSILKSRGRSVPAAILGLDSETDLALLRIEGGNLPYIELGDSDLLRPGQLVLAFGSPFGLENSVTMGVVSAIARQLRVEDPMIYIQTDAPINPGNSGGPLVDTEGRLMGINTFIFSQSGGSEGVGFAAPSNIVKNVVHQIRKTGRVRRGEIGVNVQTITPALAGGLGLKQNWGVIVGDVVAGSPAEKAGLQSGDVILTMDGKTMENGRQFDVNLYRRSEGETITIEFLRVDKKETIDINVIFREEEIDSIPELMRPETSLIAPLGIFGVTMNDQIAEMLPALKKQYGVVVVGRAADAPYWAREFKTGDIIHALNGNFVTSVEQLRSTLENLRAGSPVALQVERRSRLFYVAFEVE